MAQGCIYFISAGNKGYIGRDVGATLQTNLVNGFPRMADHMNKAYQWTGVETISQEPVKTNDGSSLMMRKQGFWQTRFFSTTDALYGIPQEKYNDFFNVWTSMRPAEKYIEFAEVFYIAAAGGPGNHKGSGAASQNIEHGSQYGFSLNTERLANAFEKLKNISPEIPTLLSQVEMHWWNHDDIERLMYPEEYWIPKVFSTQILNIFSKILISKKANGTNKITNLIIQQFNVENEITFTHMADRIVNSISKELKKTLDYYVKQWNQVLKDYGYTIRLKNNSEEGFKKGLKEAIIALISKMNRLVYASIKGTTIEALERAGNKRWKVKATTKKEKQKIKEILKEKSLNITQLDMKRAIYDSVELVKLKNKRTNAKRWYYKIKDPSNQIQAHSVDQTNYIKWYAYYRFSKYAYFIRMGRFPKMMQLKEKDYKEYKEMTFEESNGVLSKSKLLGWYYPKGGSSKNPPKWLDDAYHQLIQLFLKQYTNVRIKDKSQKIDSYLELTRY